MPVGDMCGDTIKVTPIFSVFFFFFILEGLCTAKKETDPLQRVVYGRLL